MNLKTVPAVVGAFVGAGLLVPVFFTLGVGWISLAIAAGIPLLGYILAAATLSAATGFSEFLRGMLIGFNAAANGFVSFWLLHMFAPLEAAIPVACVLGLINFLCSVPFFSQGEFYQGLVGWFTWLMPMSWPIVALGTVFLVFSLLLSAVTAWQVAYLAIKGLRVDWKTGTLFVKGGLVANLNTWDTAFNMGNFAYVDMNASAWHMDHEAGHTLNLAAFGAFFHLYGAFDEIVLHRGGNAYAEQMAESNDPTGHGPTIPIWS